MNNNNNYAGPHHPSDTVQLQTQLLILMYKTAVYTLVNGVITHQKQQISKKLISSTLTLGQCHAA